MNYLQLLWNKIKQQEKVCFFSGIVFGLLAHMYMLTNKLPNWDDLGNFNSYGVGGEFGRWVLRYADKFTVRYSNPWINGTVTILLLAVSCVILYRTLGLETNVSALLTAFLFMTFPGLTSTMTFMFTMDLYAMGVLLAVLAAYLVTIRNWYAKAIAVVCMVLSMGIYQSYICFTITILLLVVLRKLLQADSDVYRKNDSEPVKTVLGRLFGEGALYAVFLGGSTALYILCAHLRYPGLGKENYNGVGAMGSISLTRLPRLIAKAYLRFFRYFVLGDFSFLTTFWKVLHIGMLFIMAVIWIALLIRLKKDKLLLVCAILITGILPLGNSFVDIMAPDAAFSMLMLYQYCLVYVAFLLMLERISQEEKQKIWQGVSVLGVALICLICYKQYQLTGEAYFRMDVAYRRSESFLEQVFVRVESMEGYEKDAPIRILGSFDGDYDSLQNMNAGAYKDLSGVAMEYGMLTPGARDQFARIYLGKKVKDSFGEKADAIKASDAYKEMDCYPEGNCIKEIDGCWIVKLSD